MEQQQGQQQQMIDRAGDFRCVPYAWGLEDAKPPSKSKCVVLWCTITAQWDPNTEAWVDWPAGWYLIARIYYIGKLGEQDDSAVKRMYDCGLWDGVGELCGADRPPATTLMIDVAMQSWKGGELKPKANWVNPNAERPQSGGAAPLIDKSMVAAVNSQFGAGMRAVIAQHKGPATTGAVPPPPAAAPAAAPAPAPAAAPQPAPAPGVPPSITPPSVAQPGAPASNDEGPIDVGQTPF